MRGLCSVLLVLCFHASQAHLEAHGGEAGQTYLHPGSVDDESRGGRMIWMMQGKQEMDLSFLRSEHSDAIQVVWGVEPSGVYEDTFYLPNSTCTEGRNYLLQRAYEKGEANGKQYLYFIYTEDDAELEEIIDFGLNQGDPYRTFEAYLRKYLPAVGFPFNGYGFPDDPDAEVVATCWWDHLLVAFHHDALQSLLPYWTGLDDVSWWFSQRIVTVLAAAHFHAHRLQFNALAAMNTEHRWNPEMGDVDWGLCNSWMMPALTGLQELGHALCAFDNEHIVAPGGFLNGHIIYAQRGDRSVAVGAHRLHVCRPRTSLRAQGACVNCRMGYVTTYAHSVGCMVCVCLRQCVCIHTFTKQQFGHPR